MTAGEPNWMTLQEQVAAFLAAEPFAVVGASADRGKFGNRVLRHLMAHGRKVYPVNPTAKEIEGLPAWPSLSELPEPVQAVSIITPPAVTEAVVREAADLGIRHIWLQPGAESPQAVEYAVGQGLNVIAGGPCLLVEYR